MELAGCKTNTQQHIIPQRTETVGIVLRGSECMEMWWFYTQWDSVWVRLRATLRQPLICVASLQTSKYGNVNICTKVGF